MSRQDVINLHLRKSDDLCKLVESLDMGYNGYPQQLQCRNGAFVSSLMNFFDDNPGAMETVREWILNHLDLPEEEEEEEGEDNE